MPSDNIPYVLFSDEDFSIVYKPPFWIMDTDTNYKIMSPEQIEKRFIGRNKPLHIYIKYYLMKYYNITLKRPSYNMCQR
jgi:hypothetical protein